MFTIINCITDGGNIYVEKEMQEEVVQYKGDEIKGLNIGKVEFSFKLEVKNRRPQ